MPAIARYLRILSVLAAGSIFAPTAVASFHEFRIEQIYSNVDGTVQFIVMHEPDNMEDGEHLWAGQPLISTYGGGPHAFTFPHNLPSAATKGRRVLIGTTAFAALGIIAPDFTIPNNFLSTGAGTLNYANVDAVSYQSLPTNGINAIARDGTVIANLATNFAGTAVAVGPLPTPFIRAEGIWWAAPAGAEAGWGITFAHQGDTIFAMWFIYGADGKPWWLIATLHKDAGLPGNAWSGSVSTVTSGPAFGAVFDKTQVNEVVVGSASVTFADGNNASVHLVANGVVQDKFITRLVFGAVPTAAVTGGGLQGAAPGTGGGGDPYYPGGGSP
jgi:hypothetical protein